MFSSLFSVPLAALQHYLYCPRQCALIHLECAWEENQFTAEGNVFHERADSGMTETRGLKKCCALCTFLPDSGVFTVLRMSWKLFIPKGREVVAMTPVEYKVGKPKPHRADEVQVCAQALCLEEMFAIEVPAGFLFYGKPREGLRCRLTRSCVP